MTTQRKGGRPTKFRPEFVAQAQKIAHLGATLREIAEFFDITERTIQRWINDNEAFGQAVNVGRAAADARVEQSLYRRAVGYSYDSLKIAINAQGEVTQVPFVEHQAPDTTAAIFWLKNRKPAEWRDVKAQEVSGPNRGPLVVSWEGD